MNRRKKAKRNNPWLLYLGFVIFINFISTHTKKHEPYIAPKMIFEGRNEKLRFIRSTEYPPPHILMHRISRRNINI